jgi:2,2-dialkylglycine decarboxylase (pyruvate)
MDILNTNQFSELSLIKGEGCWVWDKDGNRYLDLLAGTWSNVLGHCHPRFTPHIQSQLQKLIHVGSSDITGEIGEACERLAEVLPEDLNRITFLSTGSEAVELAIKIARIATCRQNILSFRKGYYGATHQALLLSEVGRNMPYLEPYQPFQDLRIPAPECSHCVFNTQPTQCEFLCLNTWATGAGSRVNCNSAAVLFEPILASQIIVPPHGYLTRLAEIAARWGSLIIAEEVTTGLGRTGEWFGFQREGITPDILVLGKALGNGLPVAAVVTTSQVEAACTGRLKHVQSHQNDPWSGAIATAVIDILRSEKLVEGSAAMGKLLLDGLTRLATSFEEVVEARGLGLMAAIEFRDWQVGQYLKDYLFEELIIVDFKEQNRCLRFFPPYIIDGRELERVLDLIDRGIRKARNGQGL